MPGFPYLLPPDSGRAGAAGISHFSRHFPTKFRASSQVRGCFYGGFSNLSRTRREGVPPTPYPPGAPVRPAPWLAVPSLGVPVIRGVESVITVGVVILSVLMLCQMILHA